MRSYIKFITTPTADTSGTALVLHFDSKRYLVGSLGEGIQRACVQTGTRLMKVSEAFITGRTEWSNTGGMIGMILTLADVAGTSKAAAAEEALRKAKSKAKRMQIADDDHQKLKELEGEAGKDVKAGLTIFGPRNLNHTLATARRYVFRKSLPVTVHEIREEFEEKQTEMERKWPPYWADENINVWAMSVSPSGANPQLQRAESVSICPRKRNIEEVESDDKPNSESNLGGEELSSEKRDYLEVKGVVSEMFNSTWRLDTLHETKLNQVKLPATLFIRNPETKKIEKYTGPLPGGSQPIPDPELTVLVRKPWPGALIENLPNTKPCRDAVSYVFKNHTQRGKFLPKKAMELKVKKGPLWNSLTSGNSVINDDGETVTPEMVLAPSKVGGGIAVIDLPTPDYIDSLVNKPEWRVPEIMDGVGAVIWMCGKDVATDQRLHAFMKEFKHLEHLVSSPDYCPNNIVFDSSAAATIRLKQVNPDQYGVPVHDVETTDEPQQYGGTSRALEVRKEVPLPDGVHIAIRGQQIQLEPSIVVQNDSVTPYLDIAETIKDVPQAVREKALEAQQAAKAPDKDVQTWLDTMSPEAQNTEITTLGTGSALPSKYRNVSATLVRIPGWGNVFLDCGENTIGQLRRVFTDSEYKQILRDLRIIFISHMHADHQLGTTSIIKAWYREVHDGKPAPAISSDSPSLSSTIQSQSRLSVVSEPAMQQWLAEYSSVEDFGYSRLAPLTISPHFFSSSSRDKETPSRLSWHIPSLRSNGSNPRSSPPIIVSPSALNLTSISAVEVHHCHGARAVSITFPSEVKISYSGDCRPSRAFSRIGRGSTVCIHEATFDDELQGDAIAKNHSTTSEALGIAEAMRSRACVLTHFSQRYQKVPVLEKAEEGEEEDEIMGDEESGENGEGEEQGFDGMDVGNVDADGGDQGGGGEEVTLPDQKTVGEGKQYDLSSSKGPSHGVVDPNAPGTNTTGGSNNPPEAMKFKSKSDMKVCVAFDYMRIKVKDIGHMEKFTPALLELFEQEEKTTTTTTTEDDGKGEATGGDGQGNDKKQVKKKRSKRFN